MSISENCVLFLFIFLEKMSQQQQCKNCFLFDEVKLENAFNQINERHSLAFFLLNIILNIQEIWIDFCKCDGKNICLARQANINHKNYQYHIYEHSLNFDFLIKVKQNLYFNLLKVVLQFNYFLCTIINRRYQYKFKSWFTGEEIYYNLSDCSVSYEDTKIVNLIDNTKNFKVVI